MTKPFLILLFASLLATATSLIGIADAEKPISKQFAPVDPVIYSPLGWTVEEWSGEDSPFTKIRQEIDHRINSQNAADLSEKYRKQINKNHPEAEKVFRYVYATYRAATYNYAFKKTDKPFLASLAMKRVSSPHNYEFTRLRFLIETQVLPQLSLSSVGERLLRRNRKDFDVKYNLVRVMDGGIYPEQRERAITYSEELIRQAPNDSKVYAMLGSTYYKIWNRTNLQKYADKAIAAYRKYLAVAPSDALYRLSAEKTIERIEQGQIILSRKPKK